MLVSVERDFHVDAFSEMGLHGIVHSKKTSKETLPNYKQPAGTQFSQGGSVCTPFTLPRFSDIVLLLNLAKYPRKDLPLLEENNVSIILHFGAASGDLKLLHKVTSPHTFFGYIFVVMLNE